MIIVICEDDPNAVEEIRATVKKSANQHKLNAKTDFVYECIIFNKYCDELRTIIYDGRPKIYILDIMLEGNKSGITIAQMIRETDDNSKIIILTAYEYKDVVFERYLEILDYISKKDDLYTERLRMAIDRAISLFIKDTFSNCINVRENDIMKTILISDITYVENKSRSRDIIIHTNDGRQWDFKSTITKFEERWSILFIRTKANCLVNVQHIDFLTMKPKLCITLKNGEKVMHVSRSGKERLKNRGIL